jgi:hypothetical protein
MRPGVSVLSQGGAAVTTINAAGKPCTDSNFCAKRTGNQCSVVVFPSGHNPSTHLEGFTLTGGAGLPYPVPPATPTQVAGGGIFVISSPTIMNNVITNNILAGTQKMYNGGGIYVAAGAPVISNNTITGNRAVPGAGAAGAVTYGYGGGIWIGFFSDPIITSNIISGNRAGDPNVAYSLGGGGGITAVPADANHPGFLVDRNLIADNTTDSLGGGVGLNSLPDTAALAVVTNNVIVGNLSSKNGGGVYTYFNRANIVNNTITGNTSFLGGGLFSGQSDASAPVNITNNVIEGNHLAQFGTGGGVYTLDLTTTWDPVISNNDLWGNDRNQVAGDQTDATIIGTNGNFSLDPRFINKAGRDFHLDPNSAAIDRGTTTLAPSIDKDGYPRGVDGNGIPNNPVAGDIDVGAHERQPSCTPSTEVCDGQDNNCNGIIDEGFPDTDTDGIKDCLDPDDDNDGVADASDCAPLDATAFGSPVEVSNVDVQGASPSIVSYDIQNLGSGTRYEVVSGLVGRMLATYSFNEDFCAAAYSSTGSWQDGRPAPRADDAWFYIIRAKNACGAGTLGSAMADQPRPSQVCQIPILDQDADGSPSDLDCNDTNAAQSPMLLEVCDSLDNNCNGSADESLGSTTCGVGACTRTVQNCVAGATQTCTPGAPGTEVCDGADNNCNGLVDDGFPDTDNDTVADCIDLDDDNDGTLDASDCAPLDATAFGVPVEVVDLDLTADVPTQVTWTNQTLGSGTRYLLGTGQISLAGVVDFPAGSCQGTSSSSPAIDAQPDPSPDTVRYYLVMSRNACGSGTYGSPERDTLPTCP